MNKQRAIISFDRLTDAALSEQLIEAVKTAALEQSIRSGRRYLEVEMEVAQRGFEALSDVTPELFFYYRGLVHDYISYVSRMQTAT